MKQIHGTVLFVCISDGSVRFASLGDRVTLPCHFAPDTKYLCWYKQVAGDKPQIVFSFYVYALKSQSQQMATEFSKRMTVHAGQNSFDLNISNVQLSDTAVYYCGQSSLNIMSFESGIFLLVKGMPPFLAFNTLKYSEKRRVYRHFGGQGGICSS